MSGHSDLSELLLFSLLSYLCTHSLGGFLNLAIDILAALRQPRVRYPVSIEFALARQRSETLDSLPDKLVLHI